MRSACTVAIMVRFLHSQPTTRFHGSVPAMVEEVKKLTAEGKRVLFAAASTGEVERLADIFTEYGVPFRLGAAHAASGRELPGRGRLLRRRRIYYHGSKSERARRRGPARGQPGDLRRARPVRRVGGACSRARSAAKSKTAAFLSDFRDLAVGDYVVHVEHGIGQYQGLREIAQGDGTSAEFMILEYAEGARLYVPLTRLDLVQKYRSAEGAQAGAQPAGHAAVGQDQGAGQEGHAGHGGRAAQALRRAQDRRGPRLSAATREWQREFEDAFEYQRNRGPGRRPSWTSSATWRRRTPMDRLLCGDVGYGKTEVAMRAAFKAVSDNKQVAVLAPTTVLAFQHFETFKRRFAAFPITHRDDQPLPHRPAAEGDRARRSRPARWTS